MENRVEVEVRDARCSLRAVCSCLWLRGLVHIVVSTLTLSGQPVNYERVDLHHVNVMLMLCYFMLILGTLYVILG